MIVLDGSNSIYPWEPMTAFLQKLIPSLDIGPQSAQVTMASQPPPPPPPPPPGVDPSRSLIVHLPPLQVSVIQYGVDPKFEFRLNEFRNKEDMLRAVSGITQMYGHSTNTFRAIQYARSVHRVPACPPQPPPSPAPTCSDHFLPAPISQWGFHQSSGSRPGAAKVMVVVTDGESHDVAMRQQVIAECDNKGITRFGIAVSERATLAAGTPRSRLLTGLGGVSRCLQVLGYYIRNSIDTQNLIKEIKSIASKPTAKYFFNVSEEAALSNIAGTLGDRIFNIEGWNLS